MSAVVVELYAPRAPAIVFDTVYPLSAILPWLLPLPLWLQCTACAVVAAAACPHFRNRRRVRTLRFEPGGGLSAVVACDGNWCSVPVRSFCVPRFFRHYVELALTLDGGRKTTLFILPGICSADAFRHLRKYLLHQHKGRYSRPNASAV